MIFISTHRILLAVLKKAELSNILLVFCITYKYLTTQIRVSVVVFRNNLNYCCQNLL